MMCYRDMTFCQATNCRKFNNEDCQRAFTDQRAAAARGWWGGDDPPVMFYVVPPKDCYEPEK